MWGVLVIYVAAITSVLGHSDENALLQTKYIVHEHTAPQARVCEYVTHSPGYPRGANSELRRVPFPWSSIGSDLECERRCKKDPETTAFVSQTNIHCWCYTRSTVNFMDPIWEGSFGNLDLQANTWREWASEELPTEIETWVPDATVVSGLAVCQDQVVEVTGDPHMRNLNGEVFDLSREGKHILIQIPAGSGEKLEVIGTVTAFHKERKCPTFFMTQLKMKGSMVGEEGIQIVSDPENFGVKLGAATEFLNIDSTSSTAAGVAQVQRCNEDNMLCRSTSPGRRTPNYANKLLVQLPSSITIVASNYASANPSFMNLAVSGLAAQDDVGGLLGHGDHSMVAGEPECETSSRVQKISMLQLEDGTTVGHLTL